MSVEKIPTIKISKIQKFAGFAAANAKSGENLLVQTKGSLISDDVLFHTYIDGICGFLSSHVQLFINSISQFLLIMHLDESADLYVNDFPVSIEINAKKTPIEKGQIVRYGDIADMRRLAFEGIQILPTDNIIYCFKVGWKFGLYFDCQRVNEKSAPLNIENLSYEIGSLYRYLSFQYVYKIFESKDRFEELVKDGWFPFIELLGHEIKVISEIYESQYELQSRILEVVNKFDVARINSLSAKWWTNAIFKEKQPILEAGIKAYLQNTPEGYILCIKTLLPEIEGIMRTQHFLDKGVDTRRSETFIKHVAGKAEVKTQSKQSLFCPVQFVRYMQDCIFPIFSLAQGKLDLSRHTASHGLAKPDQYTKTKALQIILILNQIYFYL